MKATLLLPMLLAFGLTLTACGGGGTDAGLPEDSTLSCETPAGPGHQCVATTGPGAAAETCGGGSGQKVTSCPPGFGTCTTSVAQDGITQTTVVTAYADGVVSMAEAQMECTTGGGTWSN